MSRHTDRKRAYRFASVSRTFIGFLCAALCASCGMLDVKSQQEKMDAACRIEGRVSAEKNDSVPLVVVLGRLKGEDRMRPESWEIASHFVLDAPGMWQFRVSPGEYGLVAFQDLNRDLKHQRDEPYLRLEENRMLSCAAGQVHDNIALSIPWNGRSLIKETIDISALQVRTTEEQLELSLTQLTAIGEVVPLSDDRFAEEVGKDSLWRPYDFLFKGRPGVYFFEPYDKRKIPVLFVHGVNSTPRNFQTFIDGLDRNRFQAWAYYYPSGTSLRANAELLTQTMRKLQLRYGFKSFIVVAHSAGGLVSRGFLQRYKEGGVGAEVPLFLSISTPWGGHNAAAMGLKASPAVVRMWVDMAPGSDYLQSLYGKDPGVPHELWFTYKQTGVSFSESNDGTVTLASELVPAAQSGAVRVIGYNETHKGILDNAVAAKDFHALLKRVAGK